MANAADQKIVKAKIHHIRQCTRHKLCIEEVKIFYCLCGQLMHEYQANSVNNFQKKINKDDVIGAIEEVKNTSSEVVLFIVFV